MRYTIETQNDRAEAWGWENAKRAAFVLLSELDEMHDLAMVATITNQFGAIAWVFPNGNISLPQGMTLE